MSTKPEKKAVIKGYFGVWLYGYWKTMIYLMKAHVAVYKPLRYSRTLLPQINTTSSLKHKRNWIYFMIRVIYLYLICTSQQGLKAAKSNRK